MANTAKHQPSSIDKLPEDIRTRLDALLADPRVTQLTATAKINAILAADGHHQRVSKSAVNRYAVRMEKVGARLRQSREVARMWIGKLGAAPQGQVGHLVNEILRTLSFDMAILLQDGHLDADNAPAVVDMLKGLALTMQRLEKAASENVRREDEIRRQERERIQAKADAAVADADSEQERARLIQIVDNILGVK